MNSTVLSAAQASLDGVIEDIGSINGEISGIIWGFPMLILLLGLGVYLSLRFRFFQITKFGFWWRHTIVALFKDRRVTRAADKKAISQFQALTTALAATIGTGSIVGVATAIAAGGPGAVFWIWVSAFFGMMTNFAEKILGIYFRHKNEKGEWIGGAMIYIEKGLKTRWLAVLFSFFCLMASFGIGNMTQANGIAVSVESAFSVPPYVTGAIVAILVGVIIFGGLKRVAKVSERLVPLMSVLYFIGTAVVIAVNFRQILPAFGEIFEGAFSFRSVGGGVAGYAMSGAVRYGLARGVFSNEAGLGSSVMVHSTADVKEPVEQGMWAIFEVFFDTLVVCTLTALAILTTGAHNAASLEGAQITFYAFSSVLGKPGEYLVTVSILLFAFSTLLGWSVYGTKAAEYLGGIKATPVYKLVFVLAVYAGSVSGVRLVWELSDTFNGLMAVPNLIAVFALSGTVYKIVNNYSSRKMQRRKVPPMLSYDGRDKC